MRWVPKRRKAGPCALKVRNTSWGAHSAKAYSASTGASSGCDMSVTIESTAAKTATAKVAAAKPSTTMEAASASSTKPTASSSASPSAASEGLTHCYKQKETN